MKIEKENDYTVISPEGRLDTVNAPQFSEELVALLETKPKGCVVDLSGVSFLSSSGLQALLVGAKTSKQNNIKYGVCGMNEMVKDVFVLSGFDRFIDVFDDVKGAVESL
jgi:anti-sigma B factor antagonist